MKIPINIMRGISLCFLLVLFFSFFSCRRSSKEVVEKGIKTSIKKSGINKGVKVKDLSHLFNADKSSIKKLNKLSPFELEALSSDISQYPVFKGRVIKDPGLIDGYKVMCSNQTLRIDTKYLKEVKHQKAVFPNKKPEITLSNNINFAKAGTIVKGVPFITKKIKYKKFDLIGVFPDFSNFKVFETKLQRKYYLSNDNIQFKLSKIELYKVYKKNPEKIERLLRKTNGDVSYTLGGKTYSGEELLRKQISDIHDTTSPNIFGMVWHHSESEGMLELIGQNIHNNVKHTGGRAIWGGGSSHR